MGKDNQSHTSAEMTRILELPDKVFKAADPRKASTFEKHGIIKHLAKSIKYIKKWKFWKKK